jgi:hypothetical protein
MVLTLFTASEFKSFVRIDVTDYDTEIANLATMVSGAVETLLNRSLELSDTDITEYHSGTGRSSMLRLRRYPVTSVASLHVDSSREWDASTEVDAGSYVYEAESGILRLLDSSAFWSPGVQNIRVVYRGGYSSETLPPQLKLGALLYAASIFNKAQDIGLSSASLAGVYRIDEPEGSAC